MLAARVEQKNGTYVHNIQTDIQSSPHPAGVAMFGIIPDRRSHSHTGTRYRIRRAIAMNIDELDSRGVTQWCFAPQGELAVGDVMLAQKIALETMEWNALASANRRVFRP